MAWPPPLELAANAVTTLSIGLAARNSVHTWWTGIAGSLLFGVLFFQSQLYADVTLQGFFVATSLLGWWHWHGGRAAVAPPVRRSSARLIGGCLLAALAVTAAYGSLLHHWTDAYAPYVDSAVLAFSVVAQLLLMRRRLETWPAWLLVNTLSVPLYASRGLTLTAMLYAIYWLNAWYGGWRWWRDWRAVAA